MQVTPDGFEVETVISLRLARAGLKTVAVPGCEADSIHGVSSPNAFRDIRRVVRTIIRAHLRRPPGESEDWRPEYREVERSTVEFELARLATPHHPHVQPACAASDVRRSAGRRFRAIGDRR